MKSLFHRSLRRHGNVAIGCERPTKHGRSAHSANPLKPCRLRLMRSCEVEGSAAHQGRACGPARGGQGSRHQRRPAGYLHRTGSAGTADLPEAMSPRYGGKLTESTAVAGLVTLGGVGADRHQSTSIARCLLAVTPLDSRTGEAIDQPLLSDPVCLVLDCTRNRRSFVRMTRVTAGELEPHVIPAALVRRGPHGRYLRDDQLPLVPDVGNETDTSA